MAKGQDLNIDETERQQPQRFTWQKRLAALPWWLFMLVGLVSFGMIYVVLSDQHRDILYFTLDDPQLSTNDKFEVVYEVGREVQVLRYELLLRSADGSRITIDQAQEVSRENATLRCDEDADPDCVDEFGTVITYRAPVPEGAEPDGYIERQGIMRSFGNVVDLPNGDLTIVADENILQEEEGIIPCNRILDPGCEDLSGNVVSFQYPYVLQQALLAREDVQIRHQDAYVETVRPNRLGEFRTVECEGESAECHLGERMEATFNERVIGTEVAREGSTIRIRTVDEDTLIIPRERVIDIEMGTVECDRSANPRCEDYEGTIIQRRGAITSGILSLENNRAVNIIPEGESSAVEILKSSIVEETRNPENCRPAEESPCEITVREEGDTVAGRITEEGDDAITLQLVPPVFVEIDAGEATAIKRSPDVCALTNPRGCNSGIWLTMLVTVVAYTLAVIIGLILGLMRTSSQPFFYHASTFYIELIRGLPLLVLLLLFAFVVGPLIRDSSIPLLPEIYSAINSIEVFVLGEESFLGEAVLGLAVGYGAFLAEVFRAGIQSIGRGQIEAARSLGLTYVQTMRHIVLPQALRIILPPLGNDFIAMLKDSALISVLALPDLLQNGRLYIAQTFQPIPVYVVVALLYIILTLILSALVRLMERRMSLPH